MADRYDGKSTEYTDLIARGDSLVSDNAIEKALECYEQAFEMNPNRMEPLLKSVNLLHKYGFRYDDEENKSTPDIDDAEKMVRLFPISAEAHTVRGGILSSHNMHAEAADSFATAIELDPESKEAHLERGTSLAALGQYKDAARMFEHAVMLDPQDFHSSVCLCRALEGLGQYRRALEVLEQCQAHDSRHSHFIDHHLGRVHGLLGNIKESFSHYVKSVRLGRPGQDATPFMWKRYRQVEGVHRRIEDLNPVAAESFQAAGMTLIAANLDETGIDMLETSARIKPAAWVYMAMAIRHERHDDLVDAIRCYKRAIELSDAGSRDYGSAYAGLIKCLTRCGQLKDAMTYAKEARSRGVSGQEIKRHHKQLSGIKEEEIVNRDLVYDGWTRMRI